MIIDCNAHIGHWPFRALKNAQPDEFVELMDRVGVTQACVGVFQGLLYGDVRPANDWLAEACSQHPDRLIAQAITNPNFPKWEADLDEALHMGFTGIRLYPNYHCYELADQCASELIDAAAQHSLLVAIHLRMYDERLHQPRCMVPPVDVTQIGDLVAREAEVPIILCNIKAAEITAIKDGICASENLYVEISNLEGTGGVEKLIAQVGADSILFGTHAPYQYIDAALLKMRESEISDDDAAAILYGNIESILGR
jgi:predicted TIM-barrel fold metal-dependent hydrolase